MLVPLADPARLIADIELTEANLCLKFKMISARFLDWVAWTARLGILRCSETNIHLFVACELDWLMSCS